MTNPESTSSSPSRSFAKRRVLPALAAVGLVGGLVAACMPPGRPPGGGGGGGNTTPCTGTESGATVAGVQAASWSSGVTLTYGNECLMFRSNGLPNHPRLSEYAIPNRGAVPDPTVAQSYNYNISTNPTLSGTMTSTSLGVIGVMISGAALFNPYEGDGVTVATASNFTVTGSMGQQVPFLDACSGHPTPFGQYHYHALPSCITSVVDTTSGPSHLIGLAFDGFPIYGDRDINGTQIAENQLDACNGITSPTPEFPSGIYHYVLLNTATANSSIRCLKGNVNAANISMAGMNMGG